MQHGEQARAVFVDPSGRRSRVVRRTCWGLGALGVAYVGLVLVSLLLPPGLSRLTVPGLGPVLPGPAAAPLGGLGGEQERPDVLLAPSPRSTPTSRRTSSPSASPRPVPVSASTFADAPRRSAAPVAPTAAPTRRPTAAAPGRPTTAPTRRATTAPTAPPGQAGRTPKPRPTPTRGPR